MNLTIAESNNTALGDCVFILFFTAFYYYMCYTAISEF